MDRHGIKKNRIIANGIESLEKNGGYAFTVGDFFRIRRDSGIYMSPSGSQRVVNWVSQPHDS